MLSLNTIPFSSKESFVPSSVSSVLEASVPKSEVQPLFADVTSESTFLEDPTHSIGKILGLEPGDILIFENPRENEMFPFGLKENFSANHVGLWVKSENFHAIAHSVTDPHPSDELKNY